MIKLWKWNKSRHKYLVWKLFSLSLCLNVRNGYLFFTRFRRHILTLSCTATNRIVLFVRLIWSVWNVRESNEIVPNIIQVTSQMRIYIHIIIIIIKIVVMINVTRTAHTYKYNIFLPPLSSKKYLMRFSFLWSASLIVLKYAR